MPAAEPTGGGEDRESVVSLRLIGSLTLIETRTNYGYIIFLNRISTLGRKRGTVSAVRSITLLSKQSPAVTMDS